MEPAIRRAGRLADGYIRTRGGGLDPMKSDLHQAEEAARAAGRDASALAFAQLQNTFVWEDGDAWEVAGPYVKNQLGIYGGWAAGGDTPEQGFLLAPPDEGTMRQMTRRTFGIGPPTHLSLRSKMTSVPGVHLATR